jgi:hypothetical protein
VDSDIVSIACVAGMIEAEIVRGLLEAAGIPVWLSHESAGTVYGLTIGPLGLVDIYVPTRLETRARAILDEYHAGTTPPDGAPDALDPT